MAGHHIFSRDLASDSMVLALSGPAAAPPLGAISQFSNSGSEQPWYYLTVVLCSVIGGVFVLMRLYTRCFIMRSLDLVDGLIGISSILLLASLILGRQAKASGAGVHQWNLQLYQFFDTLRWANYLEIIFAPTILIIKLSIVVQYLKVFAPARHGSMVVWSGTWIVITCLTIFYTTCMFLTIFLCTPREKIWNKLLPGSQCIDYHGLIVAISVFNIVSDVAILALPIQSLWKLQIPTKRKVGISLLFATGGLACVASAMRLVVVLRLVGNNDADVSYNLAWIGLWSYAEMTLGLIVACLLPLPKFLQALNIGPKLAGLSARCSRPFAGLSNTTLRADGLATSNRAELPGINDANSSSELELHPSKIYELEAAVPGTGKSCTESEDAKAVVQMWNRV